MMHTKAMKAHMYIKVQWGMCVKPVGY